MMKKKKMMMKKCYHCLHCVQEEEEAKELMRDLKNSMVKTDFPVFVIEKKKAQKWQKMQVCCCPAQMTRTKTE